MLPVIQQHRVCFGVFMLAFRLFAVYLQSSASQADFTRLSAPGLPLTVTSELSCRGPSNALRQTRIAIMMVDADATFTSNFPWDRHQRTRYTLGDCADTETVPRAASRRDGGR